MARGPDGAGVSGEGGFSLKDHLFNAQSLSELAAEYAAAIPSFDPEKCVSDVLPKFPQLELMERMEAIADGIEAQLSPDFPQMADQLEAAMPPALDPTLRDDDFGRFIHAIPGILAVRHGLEEHRERALDLLYEATKRFSMEFYIRAFINRWPQQTLARLRVWAQDENYHVRRLVSEGTRPKLPWAKSISLELTQPLEFLEILHADPTRYVTRSVANHLNDIAKKQPDLVVQTLAKWQKGGQQTAKEMDWMTRHALRSLVKDGHVGALDLLGFRADAPIGVDEFDLQTTEIARGDPLVFSLSLSAPDTTPETIPVIVDYVLWFAKPDGKETSKTFKLKQGRVSGGAALKMHKTHKFKWGATTFKLFPGQHRIGLQVNGKLLAMRDFTLE